jgi:hypothetical protein
MPERMMGKKLDHRREDRLVGKVTVKSTCGLFGAENDEPSLGRYIVLGRPC